MPADNVVETLVAGPLANVSLVYRNKKYIADRPFPLISGVPKTGKVARYLKGAWFRDEAGLRAPSTRAKRGRFPTDYLDYLCKQYAFAKEVSDEDRDAAKTPGAAPMKPDEDAIEFATDKILLKRERLVAAAIFAATWSGANEDVEGGWAHGVGNTFIADVEAAIAKMIKNAGLRPTGLIIDNGTLAELKQESTVLERIKYTERGIVSAPLIAALLELEECVVGDTIYSSAVEKADGIDFTGVNIWEKNAGKGSAFLYYRPSSPGLKVPMPGAMIRSNFQQNGQPIKLTTWREPAEHQDVYEAAEEHDIKVLGTDLGYLFLDTIAT